MPTTFRNDYVHNGNDSHWLTNPKAPLTGYDRIIGIENAERTYRTRIGLIQIEQRLAGTDGLPGKGFNRKLLEKVALGNRQYLGELWRDDLVGFCDLAPGGMLVGSNGPGRRERRLRRAAQVGPARQPRLERGAALPPLRRRTCSATSRTLPTGLQGGTLRRRADDLDDARTTTPIRSTRRAG